MDSLACVFRTLRSIGWVVLKRAWHERMLVASATLGTVVAVALVTSVPLYADAVNYALLRQELEQGQERERGRPPFSFLFVYRGAWYGPLEWEQVGPLDNFLVGQSASTLGVPLQAAIRHTATGRLRLYRGSLAAPVPLSDVRLGFFSGLDEQIQITAGGWPVPAGPEAEVLEALISQPLAEELEIQVGQEYLLMQEPTESTAEQLSEVPVRIAGVWQPRDPDDRSWLYSPNTFDEILLVPEESFAGLIATTLSGEIYSAAWYLIFDGRSVHTADVPAFMGRIARLRARASERLSNVTLTASPEEAMTEHQRRFQALVVSLYAFSLPVLGLVLFFLGLVARLLAQRRRGEIALLRSRGASVTQVVGLTLFEGLLVGVVGLAFGPPLGAMLARGLGMAKSFLVFVPGLALPVSAPWASLRFAAAAVGLGLLLGLGPAAATARHTLVTYKQEVARTLQRPFWQRGFLDLLLLLAAWYGYRLLEKQGGLAVGDDPLGNPLLFLAPTLFVLAGTLLFVRLCPLLVRAAAQLSRPLPGLPWGLAFEDLARTVHTRSGPLILLIITLSLAVFSASMAETLDVNLADRAHYQTGADLSLVEISDSAPLPISQHLLLPGVHAATRVGDYPAYTQLGGQLFEGRFVGVDPADFPQVAFFRPDFSSQSLELLMDALRVRPTGLLVSRSFLIASGLRLGDRLHLRVTAAGQSKEIPFVIVEVVDHFPRADPAQGPLFVGNLTYLFAQLGRSAPYEVWLSTTPEADAGAILRQLWAWGVRVPLVRNAKAQIAAEQTRPERQGGLGLLSAGFLASAGLTVVGFLLHGLVSLEQRTVELGILRALGLSLPQAFGLLIIEQAGLIVLGAAAGTVVGLWVSVRFIPLLGSGGVIPPSLVRVAWSQIWPIYGIFGLVFALAALGTGWQLARGELFKAVKLGEVAE